MSTLTTMKFVGLRAMHEHVIELINIAAKLKSLGMDVDDNFLMKFILNLLMSGHDPFQMNYDDAIKKMECAGIAQYVSFGGNQS